MKRYISLLFIMCLTLSVPMFAEDTALNICTETDTPVQSTAEEVSDAPGPAIHEPLFVETLATSVASGSCGDSLTWDLDDTGTLTITGQGAMSNYNYSSDVPWYSQSSSIKTIVVAEGVTSIGNYAFYNLASLTSATLPSTVLSIGSDAFRSSSLTSIPQSEIRLCQCLNVIRFCLLRCRPFKKTQSVRIDVSAKIIRLCTFDFCYCLRPDLSQHDRVRITCVCEA